MGFEGKLERCRLIRPISVVRRTVATVVRYKQMHQRNTSDGFEWMHYGSACLFPAEIGCGLASSGRQIIFVLIGDRSSICVAHPSIASPFQTALDIIGGRIILFRHWARIAFNLHAEGKLLISRSPDTPDRRIGKGVFSKNTESCY